MTQSQAATNVKKYAAVEDGGVVSSNRFHLFNDCASVKDAKLDELTDREIALLGLRGCSVCSRRQTGGPALEVLEGFFGEDWPAEYTAENFQEEPRDLAWKLVEYLKERNVYLAVRRPKDAE